VVDENVEIAKSVAEHGWHAIAVRATDETPEYLYTIGLGAQFDHPEVIVFGLRHTAAHALMKRVVAAVRGGRRFETGRHADVLAGSVVELRDVDPTHHRQFLAYALAFYGRRGEFDRLHVLQLGWADKAGRVPSDDDCDPKVAALQPPLWIPRPPEGEPSADGG
jgi:hypothetical protein